MKMLAFYASQFDFKLPRAPEKTTVVDAVVAWIHIEEADAERQPKVVKRLVKTLKWMARKNATQSVLLHSFAHLSESRGDTDLAREVINVVEKRLSGSGYHVQQTPFGHTVDMLLDTPGTSSTRRFESV